MRANEFAFNILMTLQSNHSINFSHFLSVSLQCLLICVVYVTADIGITAGNNQYLPPDKGYNYDRPNVPFGSVGQPQTVK